MNPDMRDIRPQRRSAPPRSTSARLMNGAMVVVMRRPGQVVFSAMATALGAAILLNALVLQTKRHPAPMFAVPSVQAVTQQSAPGSAGRGTAAPDSSLPGAGAQSPVMKNDVSPATPPVAVLPPSRPGDLATLMAEAARGEKVGASLPGATAPETTRAPTRDGIGQLIRTIGVSEEPRTRVLAAQRALIKLGYGPAKADGAMGTETRQAIERFEKSVKLPVTGELSPRVIRELSATAGLPIE